MPLKTQSDEQPSLNLTPMIDIVFLLIIFFMVGTKFTELSDAEHELDIDVPEVGVAAAMTPAPSKRVVRIHENGAIEFDQQPVPLGELVEKLTKAQTQYPKLGVIVRGDRKTDLQNAAAVYSACLEAGVSDIGLAVREQTERR